MSRIISLLFAAVAYGIFFATFLYLIVFVGDLQLGTMTPKTVDSPSSTLPLPLAFVINVALIALFGLQHSVMARPGFKRAWTRVVPKHAERSIYVLLASAALIVMFAFWQPVDRVIWDAPSGILRNILWAVFAIGWLLVLVSTFLINHFELFGLQQAWFHTRERQEEPPQLREPSLYKLVRHPMMLGFFLAMWAIPTMTAGHLLLAAAMSGYIVIALRYEERDLVDMFGADYENYRTRVGMLTPRLRRRPS